MRGAQLRCPSANEFVDCAAVAVDLARHNIEILGEQRNDLIAKPFGQSGKAGNVREHHRQRSHRAPRPRLDALTHKHPHEIRRYIFSKSRQTAGHVGYGVG